MPTVLLPDIPRGYTWSEEHKRACLCRHVRSLTETARNAFLRGVQQHHGRPFAVALYREAMADANSAQEPC